MATRNVDVAKDYYGKDIKIGDTVACIYDGVKLAVVIGIIERTTYNNYYKRDDVSVELMIRVIQSDGTMSDGLNKQKNSRSTVRVYGETENTEQQGS
jgi:hypothetical protein